MKVKMLADAVLCAMAAGGCTSANNGTAGSASAAALYSEPGTIFPYRAGQFEIYMLVESERDGNTGILVNADDAVRQYIPESGFKLSTNAFLIKAPGQIVLVDAAFGGQIFESMRKLGVEPEQVDAVLITHLHGDHIGGLQRDGRTVFPNAEIYLSDAEYVFFTETSVNQGAVQALAPYGNRVKTFEGGDLGGTLRSVLPGISPVANYGHTPGHTVYFVEDDGARFLIVGDLLHVGFVQFPVPEISASFDMDQNAAALSRRQMLEYAARNGIAIGGMHIGYPGIGTIRVDGTGFSFTPANE